MRTKTSSILAGFAALTLAGSVALAADKGTPRYEITIPLPGGGTEHIQYTGNVAPQVRFNSLPFAVVWPDRTAFWVDPSFAAFDRMSAEMDRQIDALFQQTRSLTFAPMPDSQGLSEAALKSLPPGSSSYSWISTFTGDHVCTQMLQITAPVNGGKPEVVSNQSGDCDAKSNDPLSSERVV